MCVSNLVLFGVFLAMFVAAANAASEPPMTLERDRPLEHGDSRPPRHLGGIIMCASELLGRQLPRLDDEDGPSLLSPSRAWIPCRKYLLNLARVVRFQLSLSTPCTRSIVGVQEQTNVRPSIYI